MKNLTAFLLLLVSSIVFGSERPNIVIVYVDDLGWADTSVAMMISDPESKSDFNQTPYLEKLAARGIVFSNAYAPAPTCTPSRKSIQFGKTPGRLGYTFVHDVLALQKKLSWKDEVSMADVVKAAEGNYITAHFGKGMSGDRMETIGYDITDEIDGNATNDNFHGEYISIKDRQPLPDDNPKRMASLQKSSVEFIEEYGGKRPFFMMVSHYAVHVPHAARADLIEKYRKLPRGKYLDDEDYLPEDQISQSRKISHWRLQYAAMLEEVDQGLGAIMEALAKTGQTDNTLVIFTSDNGGGLNPNGTLRGGKANLYEGGLRVPFVAAGPGVREGVQCDVAINQWDLLPTLHDYSGSDEELPQDLDGGSLRPVFEYGNEANVERPVEGFVYHYPCYFAPPLTVIRLGDYKLMEHHLTGEQKLFNVATDYYEQQNLIKDLPAKAAELKQVMDRYLEEIDAEDVQDVYKARFAELDRFERGAIEQHKKRIEKAGGDKQLMEEANQWLKEQLERFDRNRKECRENMQGKAF
ncbi:MAG: sulfatase [Planctomycetaceae bacterium]